MSNSIFYHSQAIMLPNGISFPVFYFTEELQKLVPEVKWTIIGKPMAMLDCHVAQCYGKTSNSFNVQMERNCKYFKNEWRFQPSWEEWKALKSIVIQRLTDVVTKCHDIIEPIDNQSVIEISGDSTMSQIFGSAAKSPSLPWFYSKKGINMAAFFQSTEIARMRAMYIIEVFDEFEHDAFDPATDPRVQTYLQKVLSEKLRSIHIATVSTGQSTILSYRQLLTDLGFAPSLPNQMATKKDISTFLQMPEGSLTTFLARHRDQIQATKLTKQQIRAVGKKANRLNAYTQDDVFKIAFWMDTEIGKKLKQQIFGDLGVYSTPGTKEEVEWKIILSKMFAGLGFQYQYHIGDYIVDFWVEKLALVLECDRDNHRYYNKTEETRRDKYITRHYSLIRFNSHISIELLVNAILKIQPKQLVKLYLPLETNKDTGK